MKEVTIKKRKNSSITEDIGQINLGSYTIFAGNNNAGKTHLLNEIKENLIEEGLHVIHIPAERVVAEREIETGNQKDPMRQAIAELLEVSFDVGSSVNNEIKDIEERLPKHFDKFGVENILLKIKLKEPKNDDYIKQIKDIFAKNLIDSITVDDNYAKETGVSLSGVGQGTQRLIVASLLEYLSKKKNKKNVDCIIFEEPEIFLHPTLKKKLHEHLVELSKSMIVLISTHDPFFIQLGRTDMSVVYDVFRDSNSNFSTKVCLTGNQYLTYDSYSEINYQIFKIPSVSYFLELYQHVLDNSGVVGESFELYIFKKITDQTQYDHDSKPWKLSYISRLRHNLAHPKDVKTRKVPVDLSGRLEEAIKDLIKFC